MTSSTRTYTGGSPSDLAGNRKLVIADLTGPPLLATLQGRVELLKLSEEELIRDGHVTSGSGPRSRRRRGKHCAAPAPARASSRAARIRSMFLDDGADPIELAAPVFEALDQRGAGDSMFAAIGVGLARGMTPIDAVRLGMAAGALNVTRRGLGTGTRDEIERLARTSKPHPRARLPRLPSASKPSTRHDDDRDDPAAPTHRRMSPGEPGRHPLMR